MAEKITITINTSNGAFEEDPNEVATILLKTAAKFAGVGQGIEQFDGDGVYDTNGNLVGVIIIT